MKRAYRVPITSYYQLAEEESVIVEANSPEEAAELALEIADKLPAPKGLPGNAQFIEHVAHEGEIEPLKGVATDSFDEIPGTIIGQPNSTARYYLNKWLEILSTPGGLSWVLPQMRSDEPGVYLFYDGPTRNVIVCLDLNKCRLEISVLNNTSLNRKFSPVVLPSTDTIPGCGADKQEGADREGSQE